MAAPASLADRVKRSADMLAIAGHYARLRRAGRQYVAYCPFHKERHPSLFVDPEKGLFHCFGCGAGGDVFALVMRAERCNFRRALKIVQELSLGVARGREPRSGERLGARVGASPQPARRAGSHSQKKKHSRKFHNGWQGPLPPGCDLSRACEPETFGEASAFLLVRHE
jgi:hypothetical protein